MSCQVGQRDLSLHKLCAIHCQGQMQKEALVMVNETL